MKIDENSLQETGMSQLKLRNGLIKKFHCCKKKQVFSLCKEYKKYGEKVFKSGIQDVKELEDIA